MSTRWMLSVFSVVLCLTALLPGRVVRGAPSTIPTPTQQKVDAYNAILLQTCQSELPTYQALVAGSTRKAAKNDPPAVPVPPEIDPPCAACGDGTAGSGQASADAVAQAFINQAEQPEMDNIQFLLKVIKQLQEVAASDDVEAPARKCWNHFNTTDAQNAVFGQIDYRLYDGKAIPMANQYKTEAKRAYAGIKFLFAVEKLRESTAGGFAMNGDGTDPANTNTNSADDSQVQSLAATWLQAAATDIQNKVSQNQYNLFPGYLSLMTQLAQAGANATAFDQVVNETIQKMQAKLKFKVTMDLRSTTTAKDGNADVSWHGESTLEVQLDEKNGCYTPELQTPAGAVQFTNTHWDLHSKGGDVTLVTPQTFPLPATIKLSLCDPQQPKLSLTFPNSGPMETVMAKGTEQKINMFGQVLGGVIEHDVITGGTKGGSPGGNQAGAAQTALTAHKGDSAWLMSAEGQAAIAQMQAGFMQQGGQAGAAMAANGMGALSLNLDWTNGSTTPVSKQFDLSKNGWQSHGTVTVQQQQAE